MDAINIAARMGLSPNFSPAMILVGAKAGIKAIVGQYVAVENGRRVDQSEKINSQRNKYLPNGKLRFA